MTVQPDEEHITLYCPEYSEPTAEVSANEVTLELLQSSRVREYQQLLRVFDDRFLNVNERTPRKNASFVIPLSLLDDKPAGKWFIRLRYLLFAGILFAMAWGGHLLMRQRVGIFSHPDMYAVITLLLTVGAILIVYLIQQSRHVLVFKSKHGQIPLVALRYNRPDKYRFRQFAARVCELIRQCDRQNYYTESQILAAELSEHRRLRDEGLLSDEQYEQVKRHIMACHARPSAQNAANPAR